MRCIYPIHASPSEFACRPFASLCGLFICIASALPFASIGGPLICIAFTYTEFHTESHRNIEITPINTKLDINCSPLFNICFFRKLHIRNNRNFRFVFMPLLMFGVTRWHYIIYTFICFLPPSPRLRPSFLK